jgi:hypothetical protein
MALDQHHRTLGVISFALALAVTWALFVFLLAVVAASTGWAVVIAQLLASMYLGYAPSFIGALAGTVWAFGHGFLFGLILAWLYNAILLKRRREMI